MSIIQCAFNGEKGAFADVAVRTYFKGCAESVPVRSFDEVFALVTAGGAVFGMVPIENSTTGSIYQNYDNFTRYEDVSVVGAIAIRICHSLLAPRGARLEDIRAVYSHPQGFYQCADFLKLHDWNLVESVSTATGAKTVSRMNDLTCAAIADRCNADLYDLAVLKDSIEDNPENYTRFVLIASRNGGYERCAEIAEKGTPDKMSFTFTTRNEVGALHACLGVCRDAGLNLTKLESRPIVRCPWSYRFFADATLPSGNAAPADSEASAEQVAAAFAEKFRQVADEIRILGVYRDT